jgi:hypothetical protein
MKGNRRAMRAGFGVGALGVDDPAVGMAQQLGHGEQVVETEAIGFLPVVAFLVTAARDDRVPVAIFA